MTSPADTPQADLPKETYKDEDLVYVDPDTRTVVGRVQFNKSDNPISKVFVPAAPKAATAPKGKDSKEEKRSFWRKVYPFGTYRSMKRIFKVEGKIKDPEPNKTLEEVLPKALNEAFWNWDEKKVSPSTPQ